MNSPDIFISYARSDAEMAKRFADAFRGEGLEVWWDNALQAGEIFDEAIEQALRAAKAVIVLWSPDAVASRWVRAEATLADRNKTLVPALIAPCSLPIVFELTQTPDLSRWTGDRGDGAWQHFLEGVRRLVGSDRSVAAPTSAAPRPKLEQAAVVVLPFANMSGDAEQEYFADGISEDVITDLSQVSALRVISRNSSFTFKGKHVEIIDISRQLNVSHVLEGSVRKAGNRVRVTAQLIDGSTNDHVWAQRWDRDLVDIFELQDELSQEIVKALKLKLLPQEKKALATRGTDNLEAFDLFVRAKALQWTFDPQNLDRAIAMYRQAVQLDPDFALVWASLASAFLNNWVYEPGTIATTMAEVRHALVRAETLAPELPEVVTLRAFLGCWDYDWAVVETAIATLNRQGNLQGNSQGTYFIECMLLLGRVQEATDLQLQYRQVDPLSIGTSLMLQINLDAAGRTEEAEAEYARSAELQGSRVIMSWRAVTRAMARGDRAQVRHIFTDGFENNMHFMPFRPRLIPVLDDREAALAVLRDALEDMAHQDGSRMAALANWAIYFGDLDLAFVALRRGLVDRKHGVALMEVWMPMMAPLRRDPRFKDFLRDVGLADHWRTSGNWGDFARPVGDDDFEIIA